MGEKQLSNAPAGASAEASQPGGAGGQASSRSTIQVEISSATLCYANFCRVTGTPEELILDFGLNSQPHGTPTEPIEVSQRLVVNYYTAKRMLNALAASVHRHEQAFGQLETDVQKRVVVPAQPQASAGG